MKPERLLYKIKRALETDPQIYKVSEPEGPQSSVVCAWPRLLVETAGASYEIRIVRL